MREYEHGYLKDFPRRERDFVLSGEDNLVEDIRSLQNRGRDKSDSAYESMSLKEQAARVPDPAMVIGVRGYYLYSFKLKRQGPRCKTREEALVQGREAFEAG